MPNFRVCTLSFSGDATKRLSMHAHMGFLPRLSSTEETLYLLCLSYLLLSYIFLMNRFHCLLPRDKGQRQNCALGKHYSFIGLYQVWFSDLHHISKFAFSSGDESWKWASVLIPGSHWFNLINYLVENLSIPAMLMLWWPSPGYRQHIFANFISSSYFCFLLGH